MTMDQPLGSQYVLGPVLGRGSTGLVYEARRLSDDERLAVKVLRDDWSNDDEIVRRLLQEKRVLAGIDHPHVVRVHDLVIDGGRAAIVMELVPGGTLRPLFKSGGPMPGERVVELGRQLALALEAAHAASVMHGDVKPDNVLVVTPDPLVVKLSDFGIARIVEATATRTSSQGGTPRYMAPELFTGAPVGRASDIYSLGVLLYEALAGRPPFTAESPAALWRAHVDQKPPRPDGVGDAWWTLLERMLSKSPDQRPTAAEIGAALAAGRSEPDLDHIGPAEVTGEPTLHPGDVTIVRQRATAPAAGPRRPRWRRIAQIGAAVGVLAALVGLAAAYGQLPTRTNNDANTNTSSPPASVIATSFSPSAPSPSPPASTTTSTGTGATERRSPTNAPDTAATQNPGAGATNPPATVVDCQAMSNRGSLAIGPSLNNSGGPNWVPAPCTAIYLKLTEVYYITYAKACIENSAGTDVRCGGWVFLKDRGAWNRLIDGVSPGNRWQLYLRAEGQGRVSFMFSG